MSAATTPTAARRISGARGGQGEFAVKSSDGVSTYILSVDRDLRPVCPCKGYLFRGSCRHASAVERALVAEMQADRREPVLGPTREVAVNAPTKLVDLNAERAKRLAGVRPEYRDDAARSFDEDAWTLGMTPRPEDERRADEAMAGLVDAGIDDLAL